MSQFVSRILIVWALSSPCLAVCIAVERSANPALTRRCRMRSRIYGVESAVVHP